MASKQAQYIIRGMQRDLSASKFNPEFAYDCYNIRITARANNTLLSITNEKGNKKIDLGMTIQGIVIGYAVLNKYLVLLTTDNGVDRVYRIKHNEDKTFTSVILYTGKLNLDVMHPAETLAVYENEDILKVYWVDGLNQPRMINIVASDEVKAKWNDESFDFVQRLNLMETITVSRNDLANGVFTSGVIQYAFTYYNKYGQESNIFYNSPLNFISFASRGGSPEDIISNSFTINIANPDPRFDYIRIYSIHRTSIDATPTVKNVVDLALTGESNLNITYVDNGTTGSTVDPTELLYLGGEAVVFGTMALKDNTLFLGNANIKRSLVSDTIINSLKGGSINFNAKFVNNQITPSGYYPYKNTLNFGSQIKTFKYLEWYRFGVQLLHNTGKWTEPLFINDVLNTRPLYAYDDNGMIALVKGNYYMLGSIVLKAVEEGYIRARGVIVYPNVNDREVVALGIVCPTVYNVDDRYSNSPFVMSSWFSRPNQAFDLTTSKDAWFPIDYSWDNYINSKAAIVRNDNVNLTIDPGTPSEKTKFIDIVDFGAWAEFRNNKPIPNNYERGAEIQALTNVPSNPYTSLLGTDLNDYVSKHKEYFFIDLSIMTMHSPDIEFDEGILNMDSSGLKMRIVGLVPMTANASDIDIQTSTPLNDTSKIGFYKEFVGSENNSYFGLKSLVSGGYWFDKMTNMKAVDDDRGLTESFVTYAWHRNGSLNNLASPEEGQTTKTALLDKKKISNLKFSFYTTYFDRPWLAEVSGDANHTGITGVSIFNSNELSLLRIPSPKNSGLGDLNYYGNVDKVVTVSRVDEEYRITYNNKTEVFNRKDGYPIVVTGALDAGLLAHRLFTNSYIPLLFVKRSDGVAMTDVSNGTDPIRIKYKSTPHAVFAFNYTTSRALVVLPTIMDMLGATQVIVNKAETPSVGNHFFWNPRAKKADASGETTITDVVYLDIIYTTNPQYGFLWMAELYNDNVQNRFGGLTEEAFENNLWLPCGEPILLISGYDTNGNPIAKSSAYIDFTEGDTYFQRYDCLKTYPFTLEDQNSVVDIVSFMCETRINIEGRYDRNRGLISNLTMTPENFNKMNPVYNQRNNFFNYRGVNRSKFSLNYFPNTITWTKEKLLGSIIDIWTNITMASTLDLDGDKGEVVSLNTFNNEIFCFLKRGFSNILFNSRVLIPASDGLPIEITNGMKVNGKRYLSNTMGCNNKWSIVESPKGLYFIDDLTNGIYFFNGLLRVLSDELGFRNWISERSTLNTWNPYDFANFISFSDKTNDDIYFVDRNNCLVYSELLGLFTSFMSYEKTPVMFNLDNEFYSIKNGELWHLNEGDYNMFFDVFKPYYITIIANPEEPKDKIFNTLEFRADTWSMGSVLPNTTFDTLNVWNEYLSGTLYLTNIIGRPSPLKKKFRVWRADIPRDAVNGRDRMRNPWLYILLMKNKRDTFRTELHDMIVHYFD